ncbi:hypothetical protein BD779DRAFT_1529984 [Infundibulicybe gibba]|nr:hypothetical protein BD779DRAFT_1529984 [Infundibulicybe gibba]
MSATIQVGPSWPANGLAGLERLMIFGASYCSIRFDHTHYIPAHALEPLGVPFPGITYNEEGLPNWVGHLITKYIPSPRFQPSGEQEEGYGEDTATLVYDYAVGGARVSGVRNQINSWFLPGVGKHPEWASWTGKNALFFTWIGINDCAFVSDHEEGVKQLFELQDTLYEAGARNFVFTDVPPINRSPAARGFSGELTTASCNNWNTNLRAGIAAFAQRHPDVTALCFSSAATFHRVLDDPVAHGFPLSDVCKPGGAIWIDALHPTSAMHDIIARDLAEFLTSVKR